MRGFLTTPLARSLLLVFALTIPSAYFGMGCGGDEGPEPPVPSAITISPESAAFDALDQSLRLTATVRDQYGQVMTGVTVTWASSDGSVAVVNNQGLVTATGNGGAIVTASAGPVTARAEVSVQQVVAEVVVSPSVDTLVAIGDTVRLSAVARDANGHVVEGAEFTWSSDDESVATVDETGLVAAVGNGSAQVTVTSEERSVSATMIVAQRPTTLVIVSGDNQQGVQGQALPEPLVVRAEDRGGTGVAGVQVAFTPGEGNGSVSNSMVASDEAGLASTDWTLGNVRTQSLAATALDDLRAEFSATAPGLYECGNPTSAPGVMVDVPLRAIHASGNWGTNETVVREWTGTAPIVPPDYIAWLKSLYVNWVGISVELSFDDSMDSTVEAADSAFSDGAIRQFIRDLTAEDIDVYVTLAFNDHESANSARPARRWQLGYPGDPGGGVLPEHWPWRPDHPEHDRFVSEFWETYTQQAVHFARIAEEEGARMFSLGTETDRLFRTRPWRSHMINDFADELQAMVDRVRGVYSGLVTYDMHYDVLQTPEFFGPGSHCLWGDLGLDVVGVSAWFSLADSPPSSVMDVASLEMAYERIFGDYLIPLAERNRDLPVVFLENGAMDVVTAPFRPDDTSEQGKRFEFTDGNANGLDDGRETQANIYQALINTMGAHPGVIDGVFWWDNWMASDELWNEGWANLRNFDVRGKLAGEVIRMAYSFYER